MMGGSNQVFLHFLLFLCRFLLTGATSVKLFPIGIIFTTHAATQFQDDCKEYVYSNGEWTPTGNTNDYCCYYSWGEYWNDWGDTDPDYNYLYGQYYGLGDSVPTPNCTERVCVSFGVWESKVLDPSSCTTCEHDGYKYRSNRTRYGDDCYEYVCLNGEWNMTDNTDSNCCYYNNWWYGGYYYNYGYYGLHENVSRVGCSDLTCVARNTWESDDCKMCMYNDQQYNHMYDMYHNDCRQYQCENGEWIPTGTIDRYCCYYSSSDGWTDWGNYDDDYLSYNEYYGPGETVPTPNCTERVCVGYGTWQTREIDEANCITCEQDGKLYRANWTRFANDCLEYVCQDGGWVLGNRTDDQCCYYYSSYWTYWYDYYYYYNYGYQSGYYGINGGVHRYNCSDLICVARNTWESEDCKLCQYKDWWYNLGHTVYQDDCKEHRCNNGTWEETGNINSYCCYYDYYTQQEDWGGVDYDYGGIQDYYYQYIGLYEAVPTPNCTERVCVAANTWEYRELDPARCETCDYNGRVYRVNKTRFGEDCYQYICRNNDTWERTGVTDENCCRNDYYYYYSWWYYDESMYNGTCKFYGGSDYFYSGYHGPQEMIVLPNCTGQVCVAYSTWSTTDFDVYQSGACDYEGYLYGNNVTRIGNDCYEYVCRDGTWEKTGGEDSYCCWNYYDYNWSWEDDDCAYYVNDYGNVGPQDIYVTRNCTVYKCDGKNTWKASDLSMTDLGACSFNGYWYKNNATRYDDECLEHLCSNGEWTLTGQTDPNCCYNYNYYWDYWYDYPVRYDVGLNETASSGSCTERVCVSRGQWQERQLNVSECCEDEGHYYLPGQMRFKDDCYAYVCEDGEFKKTNNTHPECCSYYHWDYYYDYYYYGHWSGYYGLNAVISRYNCSDLHCISRNFWDSDDCKMCMYNGQQYHDKRTLIHNDCREYRCENGEWRTTGVTNQYCCYWHDWYFYNQSRYYYGPGEKILGSDCSELECTGYYTWNETKHDKTECCEDNGYYLFPGQSKYRDDCYAYICEDGEIKKTNNIHPQCCYGWSDYEVNEAEQQYEKYRQRFRWWYYYYSWAVYNDYNYVLNNGTWEYTLNGSRYNQNCRRKVCVARNTWEAPEVDEIHESCCEYDGIRYHQGKPAYKDDCIGYVCYYGGWLRVNYTDPACCRNQDWLNIDFLDWYSYYEFWWVDYDFNNYWWDEGRQPSEEWYRINKTRTNYDCNEVKCVARDTWQPTGNTEENCDGPKGCEFNGEYYNHTDRLPGCMKVYCINGGWLQGGYIDPDCKSCYARWDPHLGTFDGTYYSYHGTCSYALAQEGTSYNPQYGVFSKFYNCWGAACVGPSTYKDSSGTVIEMGKDGRYTPQLHMLYVNGVAYEIPDNIPRLVMENSIAHPVMAWRYGWGCIRLLGSSKIAVQKCGSSIEIWVSNDFNNTLYGLCGNFDGDPNDDFTKRDLSITSSVNDFGDSWEVTGSCSSNAGRRKRDTDMEDNVCNTDNSTRDALHEKCEEMANEVRNNVTDEQLNVMMDDCMFDMCSVYTNTSGNEEALNEFMRDIMTSVEEIVDTKVKTTDDDVIPAPLSDPVNTDVATTPFRPPPPLPLPMVYENKPSESKCHGGICGINLQVHIRIGNP